ncbi:disulfide bond formation protein B [Novosphingobium sp. SG720]|uniref:disulfide bond formation protein B n=1 Tax=Novosphingobium sp. SG720 TaxID=2586998 RepID=UPI001446DDD9|nr:disulfide bond formation protein B [Novosphingobium sp. SG720]NKJ42706.1 disulfide bond formation protein DsbB [Novosphingobium sp. SG720]
MSTDIRNSPLSLAHALALGVPLVAMGTALVAQYGFGLPPCEMCWWQRYGHLAAIALAILALLRRGRPEARWLVALAALGILSSGVIGAFHAGVEYRWWEGLTTCSSSHIEGDPLAAIMAAPLVRCDTPAWTMLGVSMAGFNFLFSTPAALAILGLLAKSRAKGA